MQIRIILTGGTFDKEYDEESGTLTFRTSHLPDIIRTSRCTVPIEFEKMELMDSLNMNDSHRERILNSCLTAPEKNIIIVHGTDTMTDTAAVLGRAEALQGKTIVLTGAMVPYTITGSDAVFNLGCSITSVQLLNPGVYIVMNGTMFPWDKVKKNKTRGIFESVF